MEILSLGEKIKRARIYKGFTLKDICGDEISVSKLSCIENNKILPEKGALNYIASKLDLSPEYLEESIEDQIANNLKDILNNKNNDNFEEQLEYNLSLAEKNKCYDLGFHIMHLLFQHLIEENKLKTLQGLIGRYYDLCNNFKDKAKGLTYHMDVAKFFFKNGEVLQALSYFRNVKKSLSEDKDKDYITFAESIHGEIICNMSLDNYGEAYNISTELIQLIQYIKDDVKKAKIYETLAILSLRLSNGKFEEYKLKSHDLYGDNYDYKGKAMLHYAYAMFEIDENDKATEYIHKALEVFSKGDKGKQVKFVLLCIENLMNNEEIEEAEDLIEGALNYAIDLDDERFIEKAYYFKSKVLQKNNNFISAEMYMNLSLGILEKFGNSREIYNRYMEMGKMYYEMKSTKESLKYFSLAIGLQKKIEEPN